MFSINKTLKYVQPRILTISYLLRWWCVRFLIMALNLMELEIFAATLASSPPIKWGTAERAFFLLRMLAVTLQVATAVVPLVNIAFFERHHLALNMTIVAIGALTRALTAFWPQLPQRRAHLIADVLLYLVHQDELEDYIPQVFAMVALYGIAPLTNWLAAGAATDPSVPRFGVGDAASSDVPSPAGPAAAAGPTAGLSGPPEELLGSLAIMVGAVAAHRAYRALVGDKEQDIVSQRGHARGIRDGGGGDLRVRAPLSSVSFIRRPTTAPWVSTPRSPGTVRSWAVALHQHPQHHAHHQQHFHRISLPPRLSNGVDGGPRVVGAVNGGALDAPLLSQPPSLSRTFAWRVLAVAVLHGQALVATIAAHYTRGVGPPAAALAVQVVSVLALASGAAASMHRPQWRSGVNGFCFSGVASLALSQAIILSHMDHMGISITGVGCDGSFSVSSPPPSQPPKLGGSVGAPLCCSLAITALTLLSVTGSRRAVNMQLSAITFVLHMATLLGAVRCGTISGGGDIELGADAVGGKSASVLMTLTVLLRRMLLAFPASPLIIYLVPPLVSTMFPAINLPKWVTAGKSAAAAAGIANAEQLKSPVYEAHERQPQKQSQQHQPQQTPAFYAADPNCTRDRLRRGGCSYAPGGYGGGGGGWLIYRSRYSSSCSGNPAMTGPAPPPPSASPASGFTRDRLARSQALPASLPAGPCQASTLPNGDDGVCSGSCNAGGIDVRMNDGGAGSGAGSGSGLTFVRRLEALASRGCNGGNETSFQSQRQILKGSNQMERNVEAVEEWSGAEVAAPDQQAAIDAGLGRCMVSAEVPPPPHPPPLRVAPAHKRSPRCSLVNRYLRTSQTETSTGTVTISTTLTTSATAEASAQATGAGAETAVAVKAPVAAEGSVAPLSLASPASLAAMLAADWDASAKKGWDDALQQPSSSFSAHATEVKECLSLGHAPTCVSSLTLVQDDGVLHGCDDVCAGGGSKNGPMCTGDEGDCGEELEHKVGLDTGPAKCGGFWSRCKGRRTGNCISAATSQPVSEPPLEVLASCSGGSNCVMPSPFSGGKVCDDTNGSNGGGRSGGGGDCCDGGGGRSSGGGDCCGGSGGGRSSGGGDCCGGGVGYVSSGGEDLNLLHSTGCCTETRDVSAYSNGNTGGGAGRQSQSLTPKRGASEGTAAAVASKSSCPPASPQRDKPPTPPPPPLRHHSFDHCIETEGQLDCSIFTSTPFADASSLVTQDSWDSNKRLAAAAAAAAATVTVSAVTVSSMTATMALNSSHLNSQGSKMRTVSAQMLRFRSPSTTTEEPPPTTTETMMTTATSPPWGSRQASFFSRSFIKYWRPSSQDTRPGQHDTPPEISGDSPECDSGGATHSSPADSSLSPATTAATGADPWVVAGGPTTPTVWPSVTGRHPRTTTTTLQALDASKVLRLSRKSSQDGNGGGGGIGIVPAARHSLSWSPSVSGGALPGERRFPLDQPNVQVPVGCVGVAVTSSVLPYCSQTVRQSQEAMAAAAAAMEAAAGSGAVAAKLGLDVAAVGSLAPTSSALEKPINSLSAFSVTMTSSTSAACIGDAAAVESPAAAAVADDGGCSSLTSGSCMPRSPWKCTNRQASSTDYGNVFSMDPVMANSGTTSVGSDDMATSAEGGVAAAAVASATADAVAAETVVGPTQQTEDQQTLAEDQWWIALEVPVVIANTMDALPKVVFGGAPLTDRLIATSAICTYCLACLAHAAVLFSPRWAPEAHRRRQLLHSVRQLLCRLLVHGAFALAGHDHRVTPLRAWALVGGLWALLRLRQRLFVQLFPLAAAAFYVVHELRHWQTSTPYVRLYDLIRFHLDPLMSYVITGSAMLGLAWLLRRLRCTAVSRRALACLGCFPEPGRFAQGVLAFTIALQLIPQLLAKQACLTSWLTGQLERLGFNRLLTMASPTRGSQNSDLAVGAVVALFLGVSALQALVLRLPFLQSPRHAWYCKQHIKVLSFMDAVMLSDPSVAAILAAFKAATAEAFAGCKVNVALLVADDGENCDGEYGKDGNAASSGASVAMHRIHESAVNTHGGGGGLSSRRDTAAAAAAAAAATMAATGFGSAGAVLGDSDTFESTGPMISRAASGSTPRKRQHVQLLPLSALESLSFATSQRLIVFTNDYSTSSLLFQDWTLTYKAGTGVAMMAVPLVFNGRDLGALEIVSPRPNVFDEQLRRIVVEFATQLGQALYNKVVENEASVGNRLLLQIMPSAVAEQVKRQVMQRGLNDAPLTLSAGGSETIVYKHWHPQVSVLFADVLGYTRLACEVEPEEVMLLLHVLFAKLDALCEQYGCYKVNTIGDCYIACTGLLVEVEDHAQQLVDFGKALLQACGEVDNPLGGKIEMRVGINSGRVMSGIVGSTRPHFTLYGDCVNTASRMESTGIAGTIQITNETYLQLGEQEQARWGERRSVQVKGKGMMRTYVFRNLPGVAALAAEEQAAAGAVNTMTSCTSACPTWEHPLEPEDSWDVSWEI